MREVLADIERWAAQDESIALATVVKTWGSAPRKMGAKMAMTPAGSISGSVSGGCVEGAVYEEGMAILENQTVKLIHYGVADETAWEVGLACGGKIEIFVEPLDRHIQQLVAAHLTADQPIAIGTIIRGPETMLGRKYVVDNSGVQATAEGMAVDNKAVTALQNALALGKTTRVTISDEPAVELFCDVMIPKPMLVMIGGVHIAVALAAIANAIGYRTVVVDPRRAFGTDERFPDVDQLIQSWPDKALATLSINQASAVALLTHDPKIDDPALKHILPTKAFYIGALGSKSTHAKRRLRLQEAGFDEESINRIHGPIGLNINAQTPEEIAVAIMAEIIAARRS